MNILFMCVSNSARSQLAEGLAKQMFPDYEIQSAGSNPGHLNPYAVIVMKEIGIDISKQFSKSVSELSPIFMDRLDCVITLCAEEVCPTVVALKAKRLHWPFLDPASKENISEEILLQRFRNARDQIKKRLLDFKEEFSG